MGRNTLLLAAALVVSSLFIFQSAFAGVGIIDTLPPYVNINGAPTGWGRGTATATIVCTDPGSSIGCKTGTYRFYSSQSQVFICPQTESSYTITGGTRQVTDFEWLCATANDSSDNINFSYPYMFKLDNSAPVTDLFGMQGWHITPGSFMGLQFTIRCTDPASGCDYTTWCQGQGCTPNTITSANQIQTFSITQDGVMYFTFFSNDSLNNIEQQKSMFAGLDTIAPSTTVNTRVRNSIVPVTGSTYDVMSKPNVTEYMICGDQNCINVIQGWTQANMGAIGTTRQWSFRPQIQITGTVYFAIRSNDTAGNTESTFLGGQIDPDSAPPTITVGFNPPSAQGNPIQGSPNGYWWNRPLITSGVYCHDSNPPCTITGWCNYSSPNTGCILNIVSMPNGSQIMQNFMGDGLHHLNINATDAIGNSMAIPHTEDFGIDQVNPTIGLTVTASNGTGDYVINPTYSSKGLDKVNISVTGADTIQGLITSGVDKVVVRYVEVSEGVIFTEKTKECSSQPWCDLIYQFTGSGIKYRVEVYDNAGNMKIRPSVGWYFITDHPVANFVAHEAFITMGTIDKGKVIVRNLQTQDENITVWFEGYPLAWFEEGQEDYWISSDLKRVNVTDLPPGESRTIHFGVMASDPGTYLLNMNATALVTGVGDQDTLTVISSFPPDLPGLGFMGIMLIIGLASLLYWKKLE